MENNPNPECDPVMRLARNVKMMSWLCASRLNQQILGIEIFTAEQLEAITDWETMHQDDIRACNLFQKHHSGPSTLGDHPAVAEVAFRSDQILDCVRLRLAAGDASSV